ncbi:MAG: DNA polymerase III subunit delta' C-terminal domain-containing protein [Terriglobales bacterium]
MDLAVFRQARAQALGLLAAALQPRADLDTVFRLSESSRASKEKFETLTEILYSVLQDIVYLQSGFPEAVRNVDCVAELTQLAQRLPSARLAEAVAGLDRIHSAARRNAFRPLALANWGLGLGGSAAGPR